MSLVETRPCLVDWQLMVSKVASTRVVSSGSEGMKWILPMAMKHVDEGRSQAVCITFTWVMI